MRATGGGVRSKRIRSRRISSASIWMPSRTNDGGRSGANRWHRPDDGANDSVRDRAGSERVAERETFHGVAGVGAPAGHQWRQTDPARERSGKTTGGECIAHGGPIVE